MQTDRNKNTRTKMLITGGSGFIGTHLINFLQNNPYEIIVLSRSRSKALNDSVKFVQHLDEIDTPVDVVVNLAGVAINKRWSVSYKKTLIRSRVNTTKTLVQWISRQTTKPSVLISGSAIGFYGTNDIEVLDETSQPKQSFTHELCRQWEAVASEANAIGVRTCIIRLGVVLGMGGALRKMLPAFNLGLGGRLGDGQQFFSWIHIQDVCRAINFLIDNRHLDGVFNLTAPNAVANAEFTQVLGKILHRPTFLPMSKWMIHSLFGEMGDTLLAQGQNVVPKRLQQSGFDFNYSSIEDALEHILNHS